MKEKYEEYEENNIVEEEKSYTEQQAVNPYSKTVNRPVGEDLIQTGKIKNKELKDPVLENTIEVVKSKMSEPLPKRKFDYNLPENLKEYIENQKKAKKDGVFSKDLLKDIYAER